MRLNRHGQPWKDGHKTTAHGKRNGKGARICALPRSRRDLAAERATKFAAQVSCAHRHWLVVNGGRAQAQWASTAGMPANFRQANDDEAADVYKGPGMEKRAITQRHTVAGNLDRRFRKPGSTPTEAISSALRSFAHPA